MWCSLLVDDCLDSIKNYPRFLAGQQAIKARQMCDETDILHKNGTKVIKLIVNREIIECDIASYSLAVIKRINRVESPFPS